MRYRAKVGKEFPLKSIDDRKTGHQAEPGDKCSPNSSSGPGRRQVQAGKEFPVTSASVKPPLNRPDPSKWTFWIAVLLILLVVMLMAAATIIGLYGGDCTKLLAVWDHVSPILMVIIGFYFGRRS